MVKASHTGPTTAIARRGGPAGRLRETDPAALRRATAIVPGALGVETATSAATAIATSRRVARRLAVGPAAWTASPKESPTHGAGGETGAARPIGVPPVVHPRVVIPLRDALRPGVPPQ